MGWVIGFLLGGTGGAVLGSAGAYMVNNKKVEKGGDIKWEARIPQPLYMVRTGITLTSVCVGALVGALVGASIQTNLPFGDLPIGKAKKIPLVIEDGA